MAKKKVKEAERFLHFLSEHLGLHLTAIPKRAKRKTGLQLGGWTIPPFRFTSSPLIPSDDFYPCDLCEFARYNALCSRQSTCASHAFWSMRKLEKLESTTPEEGRRAAIRHLGLKVRRPKNGNKVKEKKNVRYRTGKQNKSKRVGDDRSNQEQTAAQE